MSWKWRPEWVYGRSSSGCCFLAVAWREMWGTMSVGVFFFEVLMETQQRWWMLNRVFMFVSVFCVVGKEAWRICTEVSAMRNTCSLYKIYACTTSLVMTAGLLWMKLRWLGFNALFHQSSFQCVKFSMVWSFGKDTIRNESFSEIPAELGVGLGMGVEKRL